MTSDWTRSQQSVSGFERAMALAGAATLKEALPICLEALIGSSEGSLDCGWVYLVPEKAEIFRLRCSIGVSDPFVEANASWAPDSVHGRAIFRDTPWYGSFSETLNGQDPLLASEGLHAFAILPLFRGSSVAGCFCLAFHDSDTVPQHVKRDLEALSRWFDKTIARVQVSESRIRESWELLSLFDAMAEMVFAFDLDGEIVWINRTAREELGLDNNGRIHLLDLHPDDTRPEAARIFRRMLSREQQTSNVPYAKRDGSVVHATTLGVPGRWKGEDVLFGISRIHQTGGRTSVEAAAEVSSLERDIARMAMVLDERLSRIEEALMISPESSASRLWTGSIKE